MSRTSKGRREAYDNIDLGGGTAVITTRERTLPTQTTAPPAGALPPDFTGVGNTENIAVGSDYGNEQIIVKGTALLAGENVG